MCILCIIISVVDPDSDQPESTISSRECEEHFSLPFLPGIVTSMIVVQLSTVPAINVHEQFRGELCAISPRNERIALTRRSAFADFRLVSATTGLSDPAPAIIRH